MAYAIPPAPERPDPLEDEGEPEVLVYDFLIEHGFDEEAAKKVTLTALMHHVMLPVSDIKVVAYACGYALPDMPLVES